MKKLTNKGSRRLGIPGRPALILDPNESASINGQQFESMLRNKTVSRWLDVGVLVIDGSENEDIPLKKVPTQKTGIKSRANRDKRKELVLPDGLKGKGTEFHHLGGGWWQVYVNGFRVTDHNVRKDEAKTIATEYEE
jgi:hypothetical protein